MINEALEYIRRELRDHLGVTDGEVTIESARVMAENDLADGALITLVNIEEEPALRNTPHALQVAGRPMRREPSVYMNLYLQFSFDFQDYGTSLLNLSNTIALFQHRRFFRAEDASPGNPFPPGLGRLIFEHHNMSFEALNNLWSIMGGSLFPSVIYKVRLVEIRHDQADQDADAITTIQVDTVRR
jgi:Pvc16 N-terminal domain